MHSNPKYKIEEETQVWRAQFSRSAAGQNMSLTFCCVGANFQNFKFCIFHLDFLDFPLSLFVFSTFPLCIFQFPFVFSTFPVWFFVFSTIFLYFPVFSTKVKISKLVKEVLRKCCLGASPSHLLQWSSSKPLLDYFYCFLHQNQNK